MGAHRSAKVLLNISTVLAINQLCLCHFLNGEGVGGGDKLTLLPPPPSGGGGGGGVKNCPPPPPPPLGGGGGGNKTGRFYSKRIKPARF
jgi:hypothetical protein